MGSYSDAYNAWKTKLDAFLAKNPPPKDPLKTISGLEVPPIFDRPPAEDEAILEKLGLPGEFPFTRGVYSTMYRSRPWTMRMYAGFGTASQTNERFRYILANGGTGLSCAFDLPTQMGFDSDHAMSAGEVGKVGVAIDCIRDMEVLFNEIPLDKVSTSMTINASAGILLALYITVAEKQGVGADKLRGTIQNDLFKEYVARGTYIYPPRESLRIITDIFEFCSTHVPKWNTISVSGYHIREAGSTAVQEVAFALAHGLAYVQGAVDRGLPVDQFAPRISFFFNIHNDFLEEIAKLRAARRLWAQLMRERFQANDNSCKLRFHSQTAGSTLTAQQTRNNVVRVALQATAAALGGTQSLHTNSEDEALGLPTEASARTALRTQQIVAYESGIANFVDPLGGSWAIESLTDTIEAGARDYIERIDKLGGVVAAIEKGFTQREIQQAAYEFQQEQERGDRVIVGVNQFQTEHDAAPAVFHIDEQVETEQVAALKSFKDSRDGIAVNNALEAVRTAARGTDNLMPHIIECMRRHATLGEVSDALRDVFGNYEEKVVL